MHNQPTLTFRLEITSFEEFVAFVAVIRGEVLDESSLREMATKLKSATAALKGAEDADQSSPTT